MPLSETLSNYRSEFLRSLLGKKIKKERKSVAIGTKEEKGSKAIPACEIS